VINFHCTIIPVIVLDSVITHTSAWFLDREIHQLVCVKRPQPLDHIPGFWVYTSGKLLMPILKLLFTWEDKLFKLSVITFIHTQ